MISLSRGLGRGCLISGMIMDDWLSAWRRVGDNVHLVRKNVRFRAKEGRLDDYSWAHLKESQIRIERVLETGFQVQKR